MKKSNQTHSKFLHVLLLYNFYLLLVLIPTRSAVSAGLDSVSLGSAGIARYMQVSQGEDFAHQGGVIRSVLPAGRFTERPSLFWEKPENTQHPLGAQSCQLVRTDAEVIFTCYKYFDRSFSTTCRRKKICSLSIL